MQTHDNDFENSDDEFEDDDRATMSMESPPKNQILITVVTLLLVGLVVALVWSMVSDAPPDKTIEASYENLSHEQNHDNPLPAELAASFRRLKGRWNANGPIKDEDLIALSEKNTVENLELNYTDVSEKGLESLQNQPLRRLSFTSSPVTPKMMLAISKLKSLQHLDFIESSTTDDASLALLTNPPSIQSLTIRGCPITDAGLMKALEKFKPGLELIDVRTTTGITDKSIDSILALPKLRQLSLGETKITAAGVGRLAASKGLISLSVIGLGIKDDTVQKLCRTSIKDLNLSGNPISNKSLEYLTNLRSLNQLTILNCSMLTETGVTNFRRKRPDCAIMVKEVIHNDA